MFSRLARIDIIYEIFLKIVAQQIQKFAIINLLRSDTDRRGITI